MNTPEIFSSFDKAFNEMYRLLFKPFRFRYWLALGFIAWLACLGDGGCSFNIPNTNSSSSSRTTNRQTQQKLTIRNNCNQAAPAAAGQAKQLDDKDAQKLLEEMAANPDACGIEVSNKDNQSHAKPSVDVMALKWGRTMTENGAVTAIIIVAIIAAFILAIGIALLLVWLRARGIFMLIDALVKQDEPRIKERWAASKTLGNSFFKVMIVLSVLMIVCILIIAAPFAALAVYASLNKMIGLCIASVLLGILVYLTFAVILGIPLWFYSELGPVYMYRNNVLAKEALQYVWKYFWSHKKIACKYILGIFLYSIVSGIVYVLITLALCCLFCVPALLMMLPYTWAVVCLPVLIMRKYFTLFYAARMGEEFNVIPSTEEMTSEPGAVPDDAVANECCCSEHCAVPDQTPVESSCEESGADGEQNSGRTN